MHFATWRQGPAALLRFATALRVTPLRCVVAALPVRRLRRLPGIALLATHFSRLRSFNSRLRVPSPTVSGPLGSSLVPKINCQFDRHRLLAVTPPSLRSASAAVGRWGCRRRIARSSLSATASLRHPWSLPPSASAPLRSSCVRPPSPPSLTLDRIRSSLRTGSFRAWRCGRSLRFAAL